MSPYLYRRGSFFWALVLIAIGVIFLAANFNPAVHPWHIAARYWPVLIIVWGLSKVFDYIQARLHPETTPSPRFSGSEIILLVLILILGTLLSRVVLSPWREWRNEWGINFGPNGWENPFLNSYTYTQDLSQPAPPNPQLAVVDHRGDVEVQGADTSSINAVIKETLRAANEAQARKIYGQLKLQIADRNGRYAVLSNLESLPQGGSVRLDMTLRVPETTSTEITTGHGDVHLAGLRGSQDVAVRHGDARVTKVTGAVRIQEAGGSTEARNITGDVTISGRGGDVHIADVSGTVMMNGEFTGSVQLSQLKQSAHFKASRTEFTAQKLSGSLEMEMGSLQVAGIDGPLDVMTRQKDINVEGFKQSVKISDRDGNINLRAAVPPAYAIEIDSHNGDIVLALPVASSFVVNAASRHGEVDSDFSAPSLVVSRQGDEPSIKGEYGKGGPAVRLTTTYGTIRLVREASRPSVPSAAGGGTTAQVQ